ncbi:integrase, catalytic region, zinc finger, CCHC-type containing protein [Tanacetum coccineum]
MLDRTDFESWQQRIRLYYLGKDNGVNILKSIDEGPFKMGMFRETLAKGAEGALHLGPERDRVFVDLTPEENERFKANIRATNILIQGLPKDIYTLINHYTDAKDRETIHEYYARFTKLINDMRNIKMTIPKMQLNLKFVKNMLPEWGRLVTAVKLNKGLKQSNYDQLYAYLKQHEAHANENKMMLERYNQHAIDPLALGNYARRAVAAGNGGVQNIVGNGNPGQARKIKCYNCNRIGHIARNCTQPKRPQNSEYFKDKMLLMQAQENGAVLDEEQLLFIACRQTNTFDDDMDEAPVQDLPLNEDNVFQDDQCDAFDSDVDEALTAQIMFMANLSLVDPIYDEAGPSYDSDILSEVQDHDNYVDSVGEYHEVHEMQPNVQPNYVVVNSDAEYTSDSNIIPYEQYVKDNAVKVVQSNVSSVPNDALMMIINDMHEQSAQCFSANEHNKVVNESLVVELARYKEQVQLYEKGARFELTEREQKIDEQMRIIIRDHNVQEELLKKELHYVKMQLNSTINHNKLIKEEQSKVQPALYNGHELVKTTHSPAVVHDLEDTLEIAEKTIIGMLEKIKSTLWVDSKIKIAPLDYSKENYLATITPQRQLTLEQIFWSSEFKDLTPKPISKMTVYPPNTPTKLVPKVLPTKSQVKINIYTLTQLFAEFDKTCKKRITPCGLTEREREVREMNEIFEQMEAGVEQNVVDKQCADIERKNLLIKNENMIANWLSNEVLYSVMNDGNIIQKDDHSEMIKCFSNLEIDHLNLQLKYQNLKERFGNNNSQTSQDTPEFDSFFEINKMKEQLQGKNNTIRKLKEKITHMNERRSEADRILDFKALDFQNIEFRIDRKNLRKNLFGGYEYVFGTCPKEFNKRDKKVATTPLHRKKQVTFKETCGTLNDNTQKHVKPQKEQKTNVPVIPSTRVVQIVLWYLDSGCSKHITRNRSRLKNFVKKFIETVRFGNDHFGAIIGYGDYVIDLEVAFRKYSCYVRNEDGVELLKVSKNKSWLWHRRLNHPNFGTINNLARKDLSINGKKYILVIVDDYSRFTWVKFFRSKDETPEFVIKFLKQIQVGLNKTVRYIRTDNGTEFINQVLTKYYENVGISHKKSIPRIPQKNDVVKRRIRTLVEAARTMLIFSKALMFFMGKSCCYCLLHPKQIPNSYSS